MTVRQSPEPAALLAEAAAWFVGALVAVEMAVVIAVVRLPQGFLGAWEFELVLLLVCLALAITPAPAPRP